MKFAITKFSCTSNYRGITLNSKLAKIYSQILLNRLTKWTKQHEKYMTHNLVIKKANTQFIAFLYYIQLYQNYYLLYKRCTVSLLTTKKVLIKLIAFFCSKN